MPANERRRNIVITILIIAFLLALILLLVRCPKHPPAETTGGAASTPPPISAQAEDPVQTPSSVPESQEVEERLTTATLTAPQRVDAGAKFTVNWTGPDNRGDYVTIVPPDADAQLYGSYWETEKGSPSTLTAPIEPGTYEVRYVTGRSRAILGRAPIEVAAVSASISAPDESIAGATIQVSWSGPNNAGDYITIVERERPDGQYGHYTYTTKGSPLELLTPIEPGDAEVRYMTGQGARVLARRSIRIVAAKVTLEAPAEAVAGTEVAVMWTGPNNHGDYVTVVSRETPDGQYGPYTYTNQGSPLTVKLPVAAGDAEIRYMAGQGNKVLARIAIKLLPG